jgi:hypothetical protein
MFNVALFAAFIGDGLKRREMAYGQISSVVSGLGIEGLMVGVG